MLTSAKTVYLDSSALVKLIIREQESSDLESFLTHQPIWSSSALARIEVVRAVRPHGTVEVMRARELLRRIRLMRVSDDLLDAAAEIDPIGLRSLDAIHLAAARAFGGEVDTLVTYDARQARAAEALGFTVAAPGSHP